MANVVKDLPSKSESLSSNPSTAKTIKMYVMLFNFHIFGFSS
jgi:hypothetical protein